MGKPVFTSSGEIMTNKMVLGQNVVRSTRTSNATRLLFDHF